MFGLKMPWLDVLTGPAKSYEQKQRDADIALLWPLMIDVADDIKHARRLFRLHAATDPAWQTLDPEAVDEIISKLEAPPPADLDENMCPSTGEEDCLICAGEACRKCGAGCWNLTVTDCEHDVAERHEAPRP